MANHHFIMTEKTLKCTDCKEDVLEEIINNDDDEIKETI